MKQERLVANGCTQPAHGHPLPSRGRPAVGQRKRPHVRLHAEHFEKLGQQESRNPEASSFCNMLRRLRQHTTCRHSLKQHCTLPPTKAEAPCRKALSFPAAEASLEDGHAPSREQPLTSGRGLRRREKLIVRYDAATGKCFLLSSTTTMQSLFMSGSAIRNRAAHTVGSGASGLWDHAELRSPHSCEIHPGTEAPAVWEVPAGGTSSRTWSVFEDRL